MKKYGIISVIAVLIAVLAWFVVPMHTNAGVTHERQCNELNPHGYWSYCRVHPDRCGRFVPYYYTDAACSVCGCVRSNHEYVYDGY